MMSSPVQFNPLQAKVMFGHDNKPNVTSPRLPGFDAGTVRYLQNMVEKCFDPKMHAAGLDSLGKFAKQEQLYSPERRLAFLALIGFMHELPRTLAKPTPSASVARTQEPVNPNKAFCELYPTVAESFNKAFGQGILKTEFPDKVWKAFANT